MEPARFVLGVAVVAATPFVSGVIAGFFSKLQARQAGDPKPSILQPFADFRQLLRQDLTSADNRLAIANLLQLAFSILAVGVLVLQMNIVAALFFQAIAVLVLITAGLSRPVCIGEMSANSKLRTFLNYQPVLLSIGAGVGLTAGSFLLDAGQTSLRPLIVELPFLWCSLLYASYMSGKMELNKIFAGPLLAVAQLASCFRQAALLLLAGMFFTHSLFGVCVVAFLLGCSVPAVDYFRTRLSRRLKMTWGWGYVYFACAINLSWLYIKYLL
jgi:hypothetical protein